MVSLFALSFGLMRKASRIEDDSGFMWFAAGLYVFAGTIGAFIERLIDSVGQPTGFRSRRTGIVGVIISVVLVSLLVWFMYLVGSNLRGAAAGSR